VEKGKEPTPQNLGYRDTVADLGVGGSLTVLDGKDIQETVKGRKMYLHQQQGEKG
jgi:hypothetical protein